MRFKNRNKTELLTQDKDILEDAVKSAGRLIVSNEIELSETESKVIEAINNKYSSDLNKPELSRSLVDAISSIKNKVVSAIRTNPQMVNRIQEIAVDESLNGYMIPETMGKWSVGDRERKIEQLINIYIKDPDLAEAITKKNILGFHATRSGALIGILRQGALLSAEESRATGVKLYTGERTHSPGKGQPFTSFSDWRYPKSIYSYSGKSAQNHTLEQLESELEEMRQDLEEYGPQLAPKYLQNEQNKFNDLENKIKYIKNNPNTLEAKLLLANFPIAFGFSGNQEDIHYETIYEAANNDNQCVIERASSDIQGEFLVRMPRISLSRTPVIATTREHMNELRQILDNFGYKNLPVYRLESLF